MNPSSNTWKIFKSSFQSRASRWSVLFAVNQEVYYVSVISHSLKCLRNPCLSVFQSFTLEFHFEPNGYFNNAVLTKVYKMKSEPDASEPFSFEGPEIVDCEGWAHEHCCCYNTHTLQYYTTVFMFWPLFLCSCQIDWHKGKDVTVKTIKKKQKHKGRGTVRTVTKQVPNDSFFNFFNPIKGERTTNSDLPCPIWLDSALIQRCLK